MLTKRELINKLETENTLRSPEVIEAFEGIDRSDFVRNRFARDVYEDYPLPIGEGQTISQPTTVAFMIELLDPKKGDKILDVGSGSGWTTALLGHIVGEKGQVIGTEIVDSLVEFGQKNLEKYNLSQAKIVKADETGYAKKAPYDKVLVSAAATSIPQKLIDELKIGGTMVIPVESSIYWINKKSREDIEKKEFPGFAFVPLVSN